MKESSEVVGRGTSICAHVVGPVHKIMDPFFTNALCLTYAFFLRKPS